MPVDVNGYVVYPFLTMKHSDIISKWPSLSDFAADLDVKYGTAKAMRQRDSIPPEYWVTIVAKSVERGIADITYEVLALAAADRSKVAA